MTVEYKVIGCILLVHTILYGYFLKQNFDDIQQTRIAIIDCYIQTCLLVHNTSRDDDELYVHIITSV